MFKSTRIVVAALVLSLTVPCFAAKKPDDPAALLEKAVKAMGGSAAVDSVRTIELRGTAKRTLPNGEEWALATVSYIAFPNRYRQEASIPIGGTLITIVNSEGAFLQTGDSGGVQLPDAQKSEIGRTILRNPIALLQRRKKLQAKIEGEGKVNDRPAVILHVDEDMGSTTLALDKSTGQIVQMKYPTIGGMESTPMEMTITYSDYEPVGKLLYPHASAGDVGGKRAFSFHLDKMVVNGSVDDKLFTAMVAKPSESATQQTSPAGSMPMPSSAPTQPSPGEPAKPQTAPPPPPPNPNRPPA